MLVDSHCHLDFDDFDGRMDEIRAEMAAKGVTHAMCISVNLRDWPKVVALADNYENFYATVGVHPDHDPGEEVLTEQDLTARAAHPKVLAIGETGLDYFRLKGDLEWQRDRFRTHIRAARTCGKPLVIHTREAADDTLRLMREEGAGEVGGVLHCFTETEAVARAALEMGFLISFSGIVTFKNAASLREVARMVPADRLLVETDSPYLAPVPHRGKINQPGWVRHVAETVAEVRGESLEHVAAQTTANFRRVFKPKANS